MKKLLWRIVLGVAAGVAVYVGFSIWAGAGEVAAALARFNWWMAVAALGLAAANYLVRFVRWQQYLRLLGLNVPAGESFLVFLSGFSLTVTPGKLGEAVKAFLLRESRGIPATRTAPIVVAERFTDLVGLLLLAGVGVFSFDVDRRFLAAGAGLIGIGLLVISVESIARLALRVVGRVPGVRAVAPKLEEFYKTTATLLKPGPLLSAVALSTVSWFFECVAFWLVVHGFAGAQLDLQAATFIYAAMTIVGALSFLPGGLGATEAGMLALIGKLGTGTDHAMAAAATFVTRLATLWFAVAVGLVALVFFARKTKVAVQLPARREPSIPNAAPDSVDSRTSTAAPGRS
jgi:glycosyltransferase 2 family protein